MGRLELWWYDGEEILFITERFLVWLEYPIVYDTVFYYCGVDGIGIR